ncbi:Uncharacterized protein Fot_39802 [Forsythia ovata]|uniref:Uncharacterized protein n=1 Tax=Forsythia ovata TaxID=205694 RepID=A0ABD1S5P2_9LAMI
MEKLKKSQVLKLFLISALCIITPLLSTSFRSKYLYFIVNILIIAVGAESGLASFFLKDPENKKPLIISSEVYPSNDENNNNLVSTNKQVKVFKKCSSEKIAETAKVQKVLEKSPSTPSLFYIGAGFKGKEIYYFHKSWFMVRIGTKRSSSQTHFNTIISLSIHERYPYAPPQPLHEGYLYPPPQQPGDIYQGYFNQGVPSNAFTPTIRGPPL